MENKNRYTLYESTSHSAAFAEIERLGKLYKDTNKRNLTVDLFFTSFSERLNGANKYGVTIYYSDQNEELAFLKENVIK